MKKPSEKKRPRTPRQATDRRPDAVQIAERLAWTPRERLRYLLDMLEFEDRAHRARRIS